MDVQVKKVVEKGGQEKDKLSGSFFVPESLDFTIQETLLVEENDKE